MREKQNQAIREEISSLQRAVLTIEHATSEEEPALQVADAVAWSLFQRYERGDGSFYRLIQERIVLREFLGAK